MCSSLLSSHTLYSNFMIQLIFLTTLKKQHLKIFYIIHLFFFYKIFFTTHIGYGRTFIFIHFLFFFRFYSQFYFKGRTFYYFTHIYFYYCFFIIIIIIKYYISTFVPSFISMFADSIPFFIK